MFGIYAKSYEEIISILKNCKSIDEVVLYGSRAKGTFKEGSDIDLTIKGAINQKDFSKLWNDLDESFIPYKFDISIYNNLTSDSLKEHINRVGKVFYKRDNE